MLRRVALLFVAGFTLGACESMSQLEYDANNQDCYVVEKVEDNKVITTEGYKFKLYSDRLDEELSKGKTVCGIFGGAYRSRSDYYDIIHIGKDAERVKEFQEYLRELELKSVKQSIKE